MILNINKPQNWTSFDVVAKVKSLRKFKKVGHAGTLDPLATGVLLVLTDSDTKKFDKLLHKTKTYEFDCVLGVTTPSFDLEFVPEVVSFIIPKSFGSDSTPENVKSFVDSKLIDFVAAFSGEITQVVPVFSAKKLNGKPMYKLARKSLKTLPHLVLPNFNKPFHNQESSVNKSNLSSETANLQENTVLPQITQTITIHNLEITRVQIGKLETNEGQKELVSLTGTVTCSSGTYIRSLVNDIGDFFHTKAVMTALKRTAVGEFTLESSMQLDEALDLIQIL